MARPLVFLHLPKTAGTTLSQILRRHIPKDRAHLLRSADGAAAVDRFVAMPRHERHRLLLLRGHQVFGLHEHLAPGARYLSVVRDPVTRIASHYEYVRRTEHPMFIDAIRSRTMSLTDYASSGISGELENGQTRWIAGVPDDRPLDRSDLDRALDNIDAHFAWVGVQERFSESLVALGVALRWLRVDYRAANVGRGITRLDVEPGARDAILERNELDVELHRRMVARLDGPNVVAASARRMAARALDRVSSALATRGGSSS